MLATAVSTTAWGQHLGALFSTTTEISIVAAFVTETGFELG